MLTNKPMDMTERILEGLGLSGRFDAVFGGDSFRTRKPDPEGLLAILSGLGVPAGEALMVGDSRNDVLVGRAAGTATCGVTWGFGAAGFADDPPDFVVSRFGEIEGVAGEPPRP